MANQVIVTNTGNVQVALTPPANVQVQISRAAIGTVTNVPNANTANTVTNNAQPNITSVGTLTSLSSSGNITAPYFIGNVVGNISGNLVVPGTNTAVLFNQLGNAGASDALKFDYAANVLTANGNIVANYFIGNGSQLTGIITGNANFANFAGTAFNVSGSNVTGTVANATFATSAGTANNANVANSANSVAVANVSGIGNIATVNLTGSSSNVLYGNGSFSAIPTVSNVANANYANFAGNAFSVSGSNVSGAVANATFANSAGSANTANTANSATVANSANSVSVANVSGIGNISTINIDGNLGNVLYGNGVFAAVIAPTSVANANYANFAGNAFSVSGSNVTGTVANATYSNDAGNANIANTANSVAVANVSGIGNIATVNLDGNASNILYGNGVFATTPIISNVANANYANFAGEAFNVNASNITGTVANANYSAYAGEANLANLATFATTANSVAGANVSGEVANANYSSYANIAATANSVALANVSGIGNIANINLDGSSSNVLFGNGVFAPESTSIANANYANFAGQVVDNTQSNITSLGNLVYLNVRDNSNANSVITQFVPNTIAMYANNTTNAYYQITTQYHPNASTNYPGAIIVRSRGNATTPTTAVSSDRVASYRYGVYNGNANVLIGGETWTLTAGGTLNGNSDQAYAGGQWNLFTGNPTGNLANSTSLSAQSSLGFTSSASLQITPGAPANTSIGQSVSPILITNYGASTSNLVQSGNIAFQRARGNRDGVLTVQPSDEIGKLSFIGHNGSSYQTTRPTQIRAVVDSTYVANAANIPASIKFDTYNSANLLRTTSINSNGNITLASGQFLNTGLNGETAIGANAGTTNQGAQSLAVGYFAGDANQGNYALAFGALAGSNAQGNNTVAIGLRAGANTQSENAVAIGVDAGNNIQGNFAVAIGAAAGFNSQGTQSVALGYYAGANSQGQYSVAIGRQAGEFTQGANSFALGYAAGQTNQGNNSISFGWAAGYTGQGSNAIAIGAQAGFTNQANNSIILNATGATLEQTTANTFTVKPVRQANTANVMFYDNTTGEITYDLSSNANVGNANYANFAGNLINGTSNISIPTANANILISTAGNANIIDVWAQGTVTLNPPAQGPLNALRINTYGRSGNTGAQRISSFRFRGNSTTPLSVEPNDNTMELLTVGYNGAGVQTNSVASIRAQVDSSYSANGANIPLGWQIIVNDTNGGINNQSKTHYFYSNGNVVFANSASAYNDFFTSLGNITANLGVFNGNGAGLTNLPVANITGLGNIATLNLDGNASNVLLGNGVFSSVPSTIPTSIANGTSNVSIPSANGTIAFSVNNTANLVMLENGGFMNAFPTTSVVNMLRINTFGNPLGDAHRIAYARARGSNTSPTSVNPGDNIGSLSYFAHNGANYQTNSVGFIRGKVDSSYTANDANIPIGFQISVNDTNGGVNNQAKTHNFYANGTASFAGNVEYGGNLNLTKFKETLYDVGNVSGNVTPDLNNGSIQYMNLTGNITLNAITNAQIGSSFTLRLVQGGTGNYTLTANSAWKFASSFKTLSTSVGSMDVISAYYDGSFYMATLTTGYA